MPDPAGLSAERRAHDCRESVLVPIPDILAEYRDEYAGSGEGGINEKGEACFLLDACIAPAVLVLWAAGIKTLGCCSGHGSGHGCITVDLSDCAGTVDYTMPLAATVDNESRAVVALQKQVRDLLSALERAERDAKDADSSINRESYNAGYRAGREEASSV